MEGKTKKRLLAAIVLAGGMAAAGWVALSPQKVEVARLSRRDMAARVYGNGTVEAKVTVGIASKITGKIVALHVDQGDRVRAGELVAELQNDDLAEQVRQAEAAVNKARAGKEVEAATVRKAEATLTLAEKNLQRFEALSSRDFVSKKEGEEYAVACQVARQELARSRAALAAADMEADQALANRRFALAKLSDTAIHAPIDGLILSRDLELGAVVTPGQTIFQFTDPATVWVKANVDEARMAGVAVGNTAVISLRGAPGRTFPGRVARIGRLSDRVTEESEVDVAFTPPLDHFRLGEQADVTVTTAARKDAPALPVAALAARGKACGVWAIADGRLAFREVALGIEDGDGFVEVASGLDWDEAVAMAPRETMRRFADGQSARGR